jgi:hypothetical protein
MNVHRLAAATGLLLSLVGTGHADGLKPVQAQPIALPGISGTAYYTVEPDGFLVVATLVNGGGDAVPLRVRTLLSAGQSIAFSTPGPVGTEAETIEILRQADEVLVTRGPLSQ